MWLLQMPRPINCVGLSRSFRGQTLASVLPSNRKADDQHQLSGRELNNQTLTLYRKLTHWEADMADKKAKNRELIDTGRDKRFVRRDNQGQFEEVTDVGRSLAQDRKQAAKHKVPPGQGDRGDQKRK